MEDLEYKYWVVEFVSPPDTLATYQLDQPVRRSELQQRYADTLLRFPAEGLGAPLRQGRGASDAHRWILFYAPDESSDMQVAADIALTVGDFRLPWREGAFRDLCAMFERLTKNSQSNDA